MKKLNLLVVLFLGILAIAPLKAHAYEVGDADPIPDNNQVITGDSGSMELNGWIGTFDPTKPIDPTKPTPPEESDDWISVTLPTKILFGSLSSDNGTIYSPKYTIKNNSVKGVNIKAKSLTNSNSTSSSGITLSLIGSDGVKNVPLITDGTLLASETDLANLNAGNSGSFTLGGTYSGVYPSVAQGALTPNYTLNLDISAVK